MKPALALAVLLLLAGCSAKNDQPTLDFQAPPTNVVPTTSAAPVPLQLTIAPLAATQNDTITLSGTVNHAAQVSIGKATTTSSAGWTLTVAIGVGHTNLTVVADDGHSSLKVVQVAIRLASATMQVHYNTPGKANRDDKVWYDPDGRASASLYAGKDVAHPDHANVHDLMVTWTNQTGVAVQYGYSNGIGFSVQKIDGVGTGLGIPTVDNSYWCYEHNGASADLGITGEELNPGDVVLWGLGCQ